MSKIGNVAMELEDKAAELGFESLQEALDAGCTVEYGSDGQSELVEPLVAAHRAWEKEKEEVIEGLENVSIFHNSELEKPGEYEKDDYAILRAIKFIKEAHE